MKCGQEHVRGKEWRKELSMTRRGKRRKRGKSMLKEKIRNICKGKKRERECRRKSREEGKRSEKMRGKKRSRKEGKRGKRGGKKCKGETRRRQKEAQKKLNEEEMGAGKWRNLETKGRRK